MFSKIESVKLVHYDKKVGRGYFNIDVYYEFYNKTHRFTTKNLQLAYNDIIDVCVSEKTKEYYCQQKIKETKIKKKETKIKNKK